MFVVNSYLSYDAFYVKIRMLMTKNVYKDSSIENVSRTQLKIYFVPCFKG